MKRRLAKKGGQSEREWPTAALSPFHSLANNINLCLPNAVRAKSEKLNKYNKMPQRIKCIQNSKMTEPQLAFRAILTTYKRNAP